MSRDGEISGKYSALLAGTEVGLGGLLHAWHVPLAGHFLSLNQGFILTKAVQVAGVATVALQISLVAAILKSLSPVGKRLTPMLAITVQGGCFALGIRLAGPGRLGASLGIALLSIWGFVQPLLLLLLIFGRSIVDVGLYYLQKLQGVVPVTLDTLLVVVVGLVLVKVVLGVGVVWLAWSPRGEGWETRLEQWARPVPLGAVGDSGPRWKQVARDLLQPWFLISLVFVGVFAWVTTPSSVQWVWWLLRPIAVGALVFYGLRYLPVDRWLLKWWGPHSKVGEALGVALAALQSRGETRRKDWKTDAI